MKISDLSLRDKILQTVVIPVTHHAPALDEAVLLCEELRE